MFPDEKGGTIELNKRKYGAYDIYLGITQSCLVIAECEKCSYLYQFNDNPAVEGREVQEVASGLLFDDMGTCYSFGDIRKKYPDQLFMADCSNYEEAMHAAEIGFDLIGTTMHGYTEYTKGVTLPDMDLIKSLVRDSKKPVVAEGGIWTPDQLKAVLEAGAWTAVIGGAITRPLEITKRFVAAIQ